MNELLERRKTYSLTQVQAADILGLSCRTYQRYESGQISKEKLNLLLSYLDNKFLLDEEHGVLTLEQIKKDILPIVQKYNISLCFLFGSYAKGKATEKSDVDLLIQVNGVNGLDYFTLVEEFRQSLHKKVDVITLEQLSSSKELMESILKEGVKLYVR